MKQLVRLLATRLAHCPHCSAKDGRLTLLTSMTRYYACAACGSKWQDSRLEELP
jgi:DNA-directed RNA polymerase subunit RPC12/RpoP